MRAPGELGCARAAGRGGEGSGEVAVTVHARAAQSYGKAGKRRLQRGAGWEVRSDRGFSRAL